MHSNSCTVSYKKKFEIFRLFHQEKFEMIKLWKILFLKLEMKIYIFEI
jgi:hypothetical protein